MIRLFDWQPRLQATILHWQRQPFAYGTHDCALFAAAAVEAMTGVNLAEGIGPYSTEAEGIASVEALGFADHVALFEDRFERADRVRWGDLAVIETDEGRAIGVGAVRGIYVMTPERGLGLAPKTRAKWGLRV